MQLCWLPSCLPHLQIYVDLPPLHKESLSQTKKIAGKGTEIKYFKCLLVVFFFPMACFYITLQCVFVLEIKLEHCIVGKRNCSLIQVQAGMGVGHGTGHKVLLTLAKGQERAWGDPSRLSWYLLKVLSIPASGLMPMEPSPPLSDGGSSRKRPHIEVTGKGNHLKNAFSAIFKTICTLMAPNSIFLPLSSDHLKHQLFTNGHMSLDVSPLPQTHHFLKLGS